MRFHFPNLDRPKKAAKRIARLLGGSPPLSKVQNGLAVALGYRDWHELELAHASQPPLPLDQDLPAGEFHQRSASLAMKLGKALGVSDGEAQYALMESRLTGDQATFDDQVAIRMACWRANGQWPSSGMAGTVVRIPGHFAGPRKLGMLTADLPAAKNRGILRAADPRRRAGGGSAFARLGTAAVGFAWPGCSVPRILKSRVQIVPKDSKHLFLG